VTRADLARRVPCALCGREARGFGDCHGLRRDRSSLRSLPRSDHRSSATAPHPHHRFCAMACLTAGSANARRNHGLIDKTDMEIRAIREARRAFAEALTEVGLMAPFFDRPAEDIDRLIEACVDGFQASMQRQSDAGDVPF
jgi:hypothetical protein